MRNAIYHHRLPLISLLYPLLLMGCRGHQPPPVSLATGLPELDHKLGWIMAGDTAFAVNAATAATWTGAHRLDTREREEYDVSHLPDARWLGYKEPQWEVLAGIPTTDTLLVYCTVGYRSERIRRELRDRGYPNVYNLYGSIYAWLAVGGVVVDNTGTPVQRVHTFSRRWGRFYPSDRIEKVN